MAARASGLASLSESLRLLVVRPTEVCVGRRVRRGRRVLVRARGAWDIASSRRPSGQTRVVRTGIGR